MSVEVDPPSPAQLVQRALAGDRTAWEHLVDAYQGVAWKVASSFQLSAEDRSDVFAATFFRLFERLGTIREPEKLPGWIATTARNEALRMVRARQRERPDDDPVRALPADGANDERLLASELHVALHVALAELAPPCRELLELLSADPPLSYDEVAARTGRPRGSIGPTRQRCLDQLRRSAALVPFLEEAAR